MTRRLIFAWLVLATAGCAAAPASVAPSTANLPSSAPDNPTALPTEAATPVLTPEPAASLAAGEVNFRVVNLYRDGTGAPLPVDVYVRTQGLVQAAPVEMNPAYGETTDYFAPPDPGTVVITTAGAGDPTCVATCPHIIASSSTGFGEGDARTIILYDGGALELWHDPDPASVGSSGNALAPADPSTALMYVVGVGLTNADFGLRLGFAGDPGCQLNRTSDSILVGGNQVAVFGFDGGSVDALLFDNRDSDCVQDPVGGPFSVSGDVGSRSLLVLYGEPGDMAGLALDV